MTGHPRSTCVREPGVLRAVARDWAEPEDADVRAHAAACERCAAVRAAAETLRAAWLADAHRARLPSSAAMWWRLDRRLRLERSRRVQRVTLLVQALVLAAAAGAALAVLQIAMPWVGSAAGVLKGWSLPEVSPASWTPVVARWALPIVLFLGAWLLLVPAAVYLGLTDD